VKSLSLKVLSFPRANRWLSFILVAIIATLCILMISPTLAQPVPAGNPIDGFPVVLDGTELFRIKQGVPNVASAEERAEVINERLEAVAMDDTIPIEAIRVEEQENVSLIVAGDTTVITVQDSDLTREGQSRQEVAETVTEIMRTAIAQYRQARTTQNIARGALIAGLGTIALLIFLSIANYFVNYLFKRVRAADESNQLGLRIRNFHFLGAHATNYLLRNAIGLLRLTLIVTALFIYIPFVLSQFPATRPVGKQMLESIAHQVAALGSGLLNYLPNLVIILLIAIITKYLIGFATLVIFEIGRSNHYDWFYPEWTRPTIRLVAILIMAFAGIVMVPYLPGFGSAAFEGLSLFVGVLFGFGSSTAIANMVAGVILIYTRAFRVGDFIQVGDILGEVVEKSLFVTRLINFKNTVITIPNSSILSNNVVNFSSISRQVGEQKEHLCLHTTITLGYDVPWRKVHDVLVKAAEHTAHILLEPRPFVLQTALNDFNVSYELNACTDEVLKMPDIYSELHQNIQDFCNQAGIEILSPSFSALRDGNHSTIPSDYLPTDYVSPPFNVNYPKD